MPGPPRSFRDRVCTPCGLRCAAPELSPSTALGQCGWARGFAGVGRHTLTLGLRGFRGIGRGHGDADVALGELVTFEHLGPVEAEELHDRLARVAHGLAEPATRVDGPVQTDGREERTEEDLGAHVAVLVEQRHPAAGLLLHLCHGLVLQQVGQHHLLVAHVVAQPQVHRDVHALRGLGVEAPALIRADVGLEAHVVVLAGRTRGQQSGGQRQQHSRGGPAATPRAAPDAHVARRRRGCPRCLHARVPLQTSRSLRGQRRSAGPRPARRLRAAPRVSDRWGPPLQQVAAAGLARGGERAGPSAVPARRGAAGCGLLHLLATLQLECAVCGWPSPGSPRAQPISSALPGAALHTASVSRAVNQSPRRPEGSVY
jgi:hypothetical protein